MLINAGFLSSLLSVMICNDKWVASFFFLAGSYGLPVSPPGRSNPKVTSALSPYFLPPPSRLKQAEFGGLSSLLLSFLPGSDYLFRVRLLAAPVLFFFLGYKSLLRIFTFRSDKPKRGPHPPALLSFPSAGLIARLLFSPSFVRLVVV